jgi:nitrogen fixation protein NifQ
MDANAIYTWLTDGEGRGLHDPLDAHALASILALAIAEAKARGAALCETTGLTREALADLMNTVFPDALPLLEQFGDGASVALPEDERCLRDLLSRFATHGTPFQTHLAALIARRAMRPNHLWQDVGLRSRAELSELLHRHFAPLAIRNRNNMKWKKFFYRMICADEGFRLCTAPSCAECDDFAVCFGDESGESLLARNRREAELSVPQPPPSGSSPALVEIRPV